MTEEQNKVLNELIGKVDKIQVALLGDVLDNRIGYLEIVKDNTKSIKDNTDEIVKLKGKIKKPWATIIGASGIGVGVGGASATKGGAFIAKIVEFFT